MAKYLDDNGLLYVLQDILARLGTKQDKLTISEVISSSSTNATVAGTKAVYDYVTAAIAGVTGISAQIVTTLPAVGQNNVIYLVAKATSDTNNAYDEYMWISSSWEMIGTTDVELSGYLKTTDIADWAKSATKPTYTASEVGAAPTSHTHTKSQITDFPTSLKNPTALTIKLNGTTAVAYDGSAAKSVNVTADSIGITTLTNAEIDTIITAAGG